MTLSSYNFVSSATVDFESGAFFCETESGGVVVAAAALAAFGCGGVGMGECIMIGKLKVYKSDHTKTVMVTTW